MKTWTFNQKIIERPGGKSLADVQSRPLVGNSHFHVRVKPCARYDYQQVAKHRISEVARVSVGSGRPHASPFGGSSVKLIHWDQTRSLCVDDVQPFAFALSLAITAVTWFQVQLRSNGRSHATLLHCGNGAYHIIFARAWSIYTLEKMDSRVVVYVSVYVHVYAYVLAFKCIGV